MGPWGVPYADYEMWGFNDGSTLHRVRLPRFWAWTFGLSLAIDGTATS